MQCIFLMDVVVDLVQVKKNVYTMLVNIVDK